VDLHYVDSEELQNNDDLEGLLGGFDAILVPGGFGDRGLEGKIRAIRYAREHQVPFFGICLGMQMAVVEFARHACGIHEANSVECDPETLEPLIHLMPDQHGVVDKGATMRLGAYACHLLEGSLAHDVYGSLEISERHRHRFEVNNAYRTRLQGAGLVLSGLSPDQRLVEMVELSGHPFFLGCQFHPEFKSRPHAPHPLFVRFIRAAYDRASKRLGRAPERAVSSADVH
jgi:CTP synthase